jgi:hypothetical protein
MQAVIEHRVQAASEHGDDAYRQPEQEPALRVPGLAPGYQHPHQAAGQREHWSEAVTSSLWVAGEVDQGHPGCDKRKTEPTQDHSRRRRCQPEAARRDLRRHRCLPARWLRFPHAT